MTITLMDPRTDIMVQDRRNKALSAMVVPLESILHFTFKIIVAHIVFNQQSQQAWGEKKAMQSLCFIVWIAFDDTLQKETEITWKGMFHRTDCIMSSSYQF